MRSPSASTMTSLPVFPVGAVTGAAQARPLDDYLPAPILNILVLHVEHVPSVAGRPFFMVIGLALFISR